MLEKILPEVFTKEYYIYFRHRRENLLDEMMTKENEGLSCAKCVGNCCTFSSNSMRISPLEAVEILHFLEKNQRLNDKLVKHLENSIQEFRLDKENFYGIKKNYTCPFYMGKCEGCSISRRSKPYGCLAFNAVEKNVLEGTSCQSNKRALIRRENSYKEFEDACNKAIRKKFNLTWDLESIPVAILDLVNQGGLCHPEIEIKS